MISKKQYKILKEVQAYFEVTTYTTSRGAVVDRYRCFTFDYSNIKISDNDLKELEKISVFRIEQEYRKEIRFPMELNTWINSFESKRNNNIISYGTFLFIFVNTIFVVLQYYANTCK